jgi:two-component system OmpR family sensor kinase
MSLAFKNLIDNAIKYGSDKRVIITLEKNRLSFCNKGEPLKELLTEDREPFVSFSKAKTSGGMGLGLYIVDSIFKLHGLKLNYEYKNGCHCFFVDLITL